MSHNSGRPMKIANSGKIIKELGKKEGVITASIDPKMSKKLRLTIPSLKID